MVLRLALAGLLLAAAAATQACRGNPPPRAAPSDAARVVTALYQDHFADEQNWARTFERQRARFSPALATLLDADARAAAANADEIVGLDFDPLTDAQDTMTGFEVAPVSRAGDNAVVGVVLRQDTTRTNVRIELARADSAWRVTNIRYAHGDLVSLLQRLAADRQRGH